MLKVQKLVAEAPAILARAETQTCDKKSTSARFEILKCSLDRDSGVLGYYAVLTGKLPDTSKDYSATIFRVK